MVLAPRVAVAAIFRSAARHLDRVGVEVCHWTRGLFLVLGCGLACTSQVDPKLAKEW